MSKTVLFVFGTRPEAIKMAPLVKEFERAAARGRDEFRARVCVTAQHRQMLDEVLGLFSIRPQYDLNIMQEAQSLYHITGAALCRMEQVLDKVKPDLVLVHGDTTTTFAAALAAFYKKIPVGHVEAGLRSHDKHHPFPEEANRILTDALCDLYFAPTAASKAALLKENVSREKIFVTGNTVIDALYRVLARRKGFAHPALKKAFPEGPRPDFPMILVTAHRRENFGEPLRRAFSALRRIAERYPEIMIVYPVHLNPNVQKPAREILGGIRNILLLPPLDYSDLAGLMRQARLVVTDSGGLQEEAPSLGKPVLVLRRVTERPEAVRAGTVKIVGTDEEKVFSSIVALLENKRHYLKMARAVNPYGDGKASRRIVEAVRYYFGFRATRPREFSARRSS